MQSAIEDRYRQVLSDLGEARRWYQTHSDLFFAAVVAAVDDVPAADVEAREAELRALLPQTHDLLLVRQSLAAITVARALDPEHYIAAADTAAEKLGSLTFSRRFPRVAGAVAALPGPDGGLEQRVDRSRDIYLEWKQHRRITNAQDLPLAAITATTGNGPAAAVSNATLAASVLEDSGYTKDWEVVRILALHDPAAAAGHFLELADRMRGKRRKPLTDRRAMIAVAALAGGLTFDLPSLIEHRADVVRVGRWRPDAKTAQALAALMTFGEYAQNRGPLHTAFHGLVIQEHYQTSYAEASS